MSDIEQTAQDVVDGAVERCLPRLKAVTLKAIIRLAGQKLASITNHEEAAQLHIGLGRQHHERMSRGRG